MHDVASSPLKIAILAGEESGDILGADLVAALRSLTARPVELLGSGGNHLAAQGLKSLFDPQEIALMGFTAIITKVPRLLGLIRKTADAIVGARPDALIIIDNPDFTHRVARKVKARLPDLPVINYICPSVWAWRQGRARNMRSYIDHVLAILPFEPEALRKLGGPEATYVGHRLATDPDIVQAAESQRKAEATRRGMATKLLLLPGSRRGEIGHSLPLMREVVESLHERVPGLSLMLPTLPRLEAELRSSLRDWPLQPEIVTTGAEKMRMFAEADAALAASGTVTLETALAGIPTVAFYKMDRLARYIMPLLIKVWSASLPNLIADEYLLPESYNEQATPGRLVRQVEQLLRTGPSREAQIQGFERLRARMRTDEPPGVKSARIVLAMIAAKN